MTRRRDENSNNNQISYLSNFEEVIGIFGNDSEFDLKKISFNKNKIFLGCSQSISIDHKQINLFGTSYLTSYIVGIVFKILIKNPSIGYSIKDNKISVSIGLGTQGTITVESPIWELDGEKLINRD